MSLVGTMGVHTSTEFQDRGFREFQTNRVEVIRLARIVGSARSANVDSDDLSAFSTAFRISFDALLAGERAVAQNDNVRALNIMSKMKRDLFGTLTILRRSDNLFTDLRFEAQKFFEREVVRGNISRAEADRIRKLNQDQIAPPGLEPEDFVGFVQDQLKTRAIKTAPFVVVFAILLIIAVAR